MWTKLTNTKIIMHLKKSQPVNAIRLCAIQANYINSNETTNNLLKKVSVALYSDIMGKVQRIVINLFEAMGQKIAQCKRITFYYSMHK